MKFNYPIGFHDFHKDLAVNFQLNRFHSAGTAAYEDIAEIASRIEGFDGWEKEFIRIGERAEKEGRLLNAATYFRAAEFFTTPGEGKKEELYRKCMELYKAAYKDEPIVRFEIPYDKGCIPVIHIPVQSVKKGTVVIHGGYDSFFEEFYPLVKLIAEAGYGVYMFEGPGQGGALHRYGLTMIHQWERPIKAVLDYFKLEDVTLIGISLGGYLAARAAAYEQRIKRVVLYDLIYDFYGSTTSRNHIIQRIITELLLKLNARKTVNRMESKLKAKSLFANWFLTHGFYVYGVNSLFDYIMEQKKYTTKDISRLIKQDVLVMAGEDDIYTIYFDKQKKALVNARSVEGRVFTREENASHHCQVGNLKLAMDYIIEWLDRKTSE